MSKIKQIQIGDDTYDLSVNAGDIDGSVSGTVPQGGTQGQVLVKNSGTDFDTVWRSIESGDIFFLGDIEDYKTQQTALNLDNLKAGLYSIHTEKYNTNTYLYVKATINGTVYTTSKNVYF